ncbi:MAG: glycoside hydrolase family 43 protein [Thermoguttaceae bacterium]|jgi:hypothetical protein
MRNVFIGIVLAAIATFSFSTSFLGIQASEPGDNSGYYVFPYFINNGEDGVHYAVSRDGYVWKALNGGKAIMAPPFGDDAGLTRDPSVTREPDGIFRMVWTVGWGGQYFGYACSDDLIEWRDTQLIPAMTHEPTARNTWAPEIFYDDNTEQFYIVWSSTVPGKFSPADKGTSEEQYDHRVYFTTTKDFKTFAPTKLYFDPGHNVIDAFLTKKDDVYHLFYKDETLFPEAKKFILEATGPSAEGPFSEGKRVSAHDWVEGPCALIIGNDWLVYYDRYGEGKYGAVRSRDGVEWEDVSDLTSFPDGIREGSPFKVDQEIYDNLVEKFGLSE